MGEVQIANVPCLGRVLLPRNAQMSCRPVGRSHQKKPNIVRYGKAFSTAPESLDARLIWRALGL
jgi:hypothetical protein